MSTILVFFVDLLILLGLWRRLFPTTFMLRVSFSPVPECVVIGLLETSFSDPPRPPGTPLLLLLLLYQTNWFALWLIFLKPDVHYTTMYFNFFFGNSFFNSVFIIFFFHIFIIFNIFMFFQFAKRYYAGAPPSKSQKLSQKKLCSQQLHQHVTLLIFPRSTSY